MKISSFGEVLWDDFPSGKVLGGAPLNILIRLGGLGAECSIISRKGNDEYGEQLLSLIEAKNVAVDLIQTDHEHATSLVKVILQSDGSASYDIVYPCAWDKITVTEEALLRVAESDAFVFGSLSTRDPVSRATLSELLPAARFRVFDYGRFGRQLFGRLYFQTALRQPTRRNTGLRLCNGRFERLIAGCNARFAVRWHYATGAATIKPPYPINLPIILFRRPA